MIYVYLQAMLLIVGVADTGCSKYIPGEMSCKKTLDSVFVTSGDTLILNCTCFDKTNGQWTGPNNLIYSSTNHDIPYAHGTDINPRLNKSKYMVIGGYVLKKCSLKIKNFVSDDDGTYMCRYINSTTTFIHVYKVEATNISSDNHVEKSTMTETYSFEPKHPAFVSSSSYSYCWVIMGSLVGVLVTYFIVSHIFYCLNHAPKSSLDISREIQYDEIGTINYNDVILEPISDLNHEATSSFNDNNDNLFRADVDSSNESSVIRHSNITQQNDDYENPYHTINPEHIEIHPYSSILSNNYQNTSIFPVSSGT